MCVEKMYDACMCVYKQECVCVAVNVRCFKFQVFLIVVCFRYPAGNMYPYVFTFMCDQHIDSS